MRISDWSSDVCSSDLTGAARRPRRRLSSSSWPTTAPVSWPCERATCTLLLCRPGRTRSTACARQGCWRSEEHTSELQSLMRISYAVFCLKKKKQVNNILKRKKPLNTQTKHSVNVNTQLLSPINNYVSHIVIHEP